MPIEFRCVNCERLLRTADGTAGKQAECPGCGQVLTIPVQESEATSAESSDDAARQQTSPFRAEQGSSNVNPYQAPAYSPSSSETGVLHDEGKLQHTQIEFSEILSRAWERFSSQLGIGVLFSLCLLGIYLAGCCIGNCFIVVPLQMLGGAGVGEPTLVVLSQVLSQIAQQVWGSIISSIVNCITILFALNLLRGNPAPLNAMWNVGPYFLRLFLLQMLIAVVAFLVVVACGLPMGIAALTQDETFFLIGAIITCVLAIPAIWFGIVYGFGIVLASYFIIDRGNGVIEAIRNSLYFMRGNKLMTFAIFVVVGFLTILFVLVTLGFGMLFVWPYTALLMAVIYLSATGQWRVPEASPLAT